MVVKRYREELVVCYFNVTVARHRRIWQRELLAVFMNSGREAFDLLQVVRFEAYSDVLSVRLYFIGDFFRFFPRYDSGSAEFTGYSEGTDDGEAFIHCYFSHWFLVGQQGIYGFGLVKQLRQCQDFAIHGFAGVFGVNSL